jgi:uncharacterized membrane protein
MPWWVIPGIPLFFGCAIFLAIITIRGQRAGKLAARDLVIRWACVAIFLWMAIAPFVRHLISS